MATSTQFTNPAAVAASPRHSSLVLWHLLSLDAPTVAALWIWFVARANHVSLPASSVFAMFVAVWLLYAADRLLDTRPNAKALQDLEERHYFHRAHHRAFTAGIILASIALAALLPHLPAQSLRLYLILGGFLFVYFILIHTVALGGFRLPKELAVGIFFAAATFIPTVSRQPELRLTLLPAAILFAILCMLNCFFIHAWEHPPKTIRLQFLSIVSIAVSISGLALTLFDQLLPWPIPVACALAAALLLILHHNRNRLTRNTLRAAADLCLLTPLLLLLHLPR